ncbi:MAG: helix-turn-helix domain-containing protein [Anaerolineae bacterium]|nr:helix-turn-helix domain-containing protein [Anaerolineae bacterium]
MTKRKPEPKLLPADVPVEMPDLPHAFTITTEAQFKAIGDPVRNRILGIIQQHPATAKQIADRLNATPGAIGHHLKVLEQAGLAMIVARRVTRGIIAKYYTRTARLFNYAAPEGVRAALHPMLDIVNTTRDELAQALADGVPGLEEGFYMAGFPRVRLSKSKIEKYAQRIEAIKDNLLKEKPDSNGVVMGFGFAFFTQPNYVQSLGTSSAEAQSPKPAKRTRKQK